MIIKDLIKINKKLNVAYELVKVEADKEYNKQLEKVLNILFDVCLTLDME